MTHLSALNYYELAAPIWRVSVGSARIDLHNLLIFLQLRMHKHAQAEIRSFANIIGKEIVAKWVPTVWHVFSHLVPYGSVHYLFNRSRK
ncbi:FAD-dependent thymidylate synthase [Bradyrhizobium glycinis]|uniref:FAD-dependent thymidylate synthase n=1 Tax=Bradyrhizobium glycinis TaxID=2751812 RepID=UPI001AED7AF8|nr:FAD-dependent thymidylate synthase [Bradyrhizobium glycinis]